MRYSRRFFENLYADAYRAARDAATPELREELLSAWNAVAAAWQEASRNGYRLTAA